MMAAATFGTCGAPSSEKILGIVLAGGEGSRLRPLTTNHAKPALPVGGGARLVDFVLSNLVNSGIDSIYLLAQHKPESLIRYIHSNWRLRPDGSERFMRVVLPQHEHGGCYRGTADAVYQNLALIERHAPNLVAVFAADHVFRMDVRQMVSYHRECGAEITIAATQVPIAQVSSYAIIEAGCRGEIWGLRDRQDAPIAVPSALDRAYVSMGNYLFDTSVLVEELEWALRHGETDFGRDILPRLIHTHQVHAYDFASNTVPGVQPHEEAAYWCEVGTLEAYAQAHQDITGSLPRFNLHNPQWPIRTAAIAQQQPSPGAGRAHHARAMLNSHLPVPFANGCLSEGKLNDIRPGKV